MKMEIKVTPHAQQQLELMADVDSIKNGFVLGGMIGKYMIVDNFFPANFNKKNIDAHYQSAFEKMGEKLLGVFFNNGEPFICDWFLEDVIFKIKSRCFEYEICDSSAGSARETREKHEKRKTINTYTTNKGK